LVTLIGNNCGSKLTENFLQLFPSFITRLLVCFDGIGRVFACAHKAMPRAFISHRLILLPSRFHQFLALRDGRRHARIVAAVEAINGALDLGHRFGTFRPGAVENKRGGEAWTIGGETESLAASPAKARDRDFAVRGGQLDDVIGYGIQIRSHLVWCITQLGESLADTSSVRK